VCSNKKVKLADGKDPSDEILVVPPAANDDSKLKVSYKENLVGILPWQRRSKLMIWSLRVIQIRKMKMIVQRFVFRLYVNVGSENLGKFYTEDDDRSVLFGGPWMVADQHASCSRIKAKFWSWWGQTWQSGGLGKSSQVVFGILQQRPSHAYR